MSLFGIFILRKKLPDKDRPFKVPLYPFVPAVAILGGAYIVISTLVKQTTNSLIGILVTLTGFPVYYLIKHNNKS
jgi:APA family basic amino acid/polyamine antiporter